MSYNLQRLELPFCWVFALWFPAAEHGEADGARRRPEQHPNGHEREEDQHAAIALETTRIEELGPGIAEGNAGDRANDAAQHHPYGHEETHGGFSRCSINPRCGGSASPPPSSPPASAR